MYENILEEAINQNASDIHIEPYSDNVIVRIRVDGELKEISRVSLETYKSLLSIIKLSASMDITEKRLPQDGRTEYKINNKIIDIRASSVPTISGEKIALRLLNRETFIKNKEELGFSKVAIDKINNIIKKGYGIVLITGPTGSGKTTTVYSILNDLKCMNKNIMTIEDPVEYKIEGINQIQVNNKIGLDFEFGLKSILRQDPDVIIVGEIRDVETAKIAMRAATTGHLVISTMHTSDSISSISRLLEMNIPKYLINESLIGIISQRLIKKSNILNRNYEKLGISKNVLLDNKEYYEDEFSGRTLIYEILDIDDEIKESIRNNDNFKNIRDISIKNKMITFENSYDYFIESYNNKEIASFNEVGATCN